MMIIGGIVAVMIGIASLIMYIDGNAVARLERDRIVEALHTTQEAHEAADRNREVTEAASRTKDAEIAGLRDELGELRATIEPGQPCPRHCVLPE